MRGYTHMERKTRRALWTCLALAAAIAATSALGVASARTLAAPVNTAPPTVTGTASVGQTLTAQDGTWSNSPTTYQYRWLRCNTQGEGCAAISGAIQKTYTVTS